MKLYSKLFFVLVLLTAEVTHSYLDKENGWLDIITTAIADYNERTGNTPLAQPNIPLIVRFINDPEAMAQFKVFSRTELLALSGENHRIALHYLNLKKYLETFKRQLKDDLEAPFDFMRY